MDRHTLSTVLQAAVTASSGSLWLLASALARSLLKVDHFRQPGQFCKNGYALSGVDKAHLPTVLLNLKPVKAKRAVKEVEYRDVALRLVHKITGIGRSLNDPGKSLLSLRAIV